MASSNRSRGGSGSSQDEEPDEFPPTVATDFDTEESAGQIRGLAEQASTSPWLRIGLAAALALAVLVLYAVVRAVKHQDLQLFASELEVLIRAVGEVIRKPPRDGVGDSGTEWTPGSAQPDLALSLLSDVAEKSNMAKQVLEVAMLKWAASPTGIRGDPGRER